MMTFGHVLDELIRICEEHAASKASIERYCVVRDVKGRIRLVVRLTGNEPTGLEDLENALQRVLGAYFVGPILSTKSGAETQRLANKLLERAQDKWPNRWPSETRSALGIATKIQTKTRWTGIERTIGKEAWLADSPPAPPWPLRPGKTPPIITFHSFKGGAGRTTLVAAFALELANQVTQERIAVIDLDLEAPGLGSLFGVETERGVLDILVDHLATGTIDLIDASSPARLPGHLQDRVTVFPAGRLDDAYLQKLARLDFSSAQPDSSNPVGVALIAMLTKMKADFDFILLDSRAGLHDLAGMSLHGLAHIDVLVFRGTEQSFAGLGQTLRTLGPRSFGRLVLVETMLPANDDELFQLRRARTREHVYRLLSEHVYVPEDPESPEPPQPADLGEPHDVIHVRRREWLDGLDSISEKAMDVLRDDDLRAVGERILDTLGIDVDDAEDELP